MAALRTYDGRRLERLIGISDAITAVAITLLAVPLIGLGLPEQGEPFDDYLAMKAGPIVAFVFTFLIVFGQWRVHNRMLSDLVAYDTVVFWINAAWLASIAFLPWPSALAGEAWESGRVTATGAGGPVALFYWVSLAIVIAMATAMRAYVLRHPHLVDPRHWADWDSSRAAVRLRSAVLIIGFLACGIGWYFSMLAGLTCLVLTFVSMMVLGRLERGHEARSGNATVT